MSNLYKKCTKCGEIKLATNEYFKKMKGGKYGLAARCKICDKEHREKNKERIKEQQKKWRENNKEYMKEYNKKRYENNKEYHKEYYKEYYENNKDRIKEHVKEYNENNKERKKEHNKEYYEKNKNRIKEQHKEYYENNKDRIKEQKKEYNENNKEHINERQKEYYESERGQVVSFNARCKRRIKKQNQGSGINEDQWLEMMKYFEFRCAYSGKILKVGTRSIDHIAPLNQGGEHEVWNCVPMYKSYNSSKNDKDLLEWYQKQPFYSEERLQKIYEWQEYAFNKYGK